MGAKYEVNIERSDDSYAILHNVANNWLMKAPTNDRSAGDTVALKPISIFSK